MKHDIETHPKFKRLKMRLGLPLWQAKGVLEALFNLTIQRARRGDVGRLCNEDIAAAIEWSGDADELVAALVETGWLDECDEHRLVVHDWHDHAPAFVKGIVSRSAEGWATKFETKCATESSTKPPTKSATKQVAGLGSRSKGSLPEGESEGEGSERDAFAPGRVPWGEFGPVGDDLEFRAAIWEFDAYRRSKLAEHDKRNPFPTVAVRRAAQRIVRDRLTAAQARRAFEEAIERTWDGPVWPKDSGASERPVVDVGAAVARAGAKANGGRR